MALSAQRKGFRRRLPAQNAEEEAIGKEIEVYPALSLPLVLGLLSGSGPEKPFEVVAGPLSKHLLRERWATAWGE